MGSEWRFSVIEWIAGTGKSVLTANVVSHLRGRLNSSNSIVLHYFFRAIDTNRMELNGLQHSLVRQLLRQDLTGYRHVQRLEESTHDLADEDYLDLVAELIPRERTVFMVIDRADDTECSEFDRLVSFITSIGERRPEAKIFLSGRAVTPWMKLPTLLSVNMAESLPDADLSCYIDTRFESMDISDYLTSSMREQLVSQVVKKAMKKARKL
jgi:hypothetical protein